MKCMSILKNFNGIADKKRPALLLAVLLLMAMITGCDLTDNGGEENNTNNSSEAQVTGRPVIESPETNMDTAEIHFIDVGQGDSTLIIADNEAMLIDCGDNDKGMEVRRYLEKQGIEELEYVIGTHPDADHIGGMDVVLYNFYCDTIIMPDGDPQTKTYDDVINTMNNKNYEITYPKVGDAYKLGSGSFTIIAPNSEDYSSWNDFSVGLIFDYGDTSFVFTGDAEGAEADIVKNGIDLSADVFKAGHHGSRTSSSDALLDAINPQYAVISCGAGNKYGHPNQEILEKFSARNIEVYRTDTQGTVIAYTDGINITWSCTKNESIPPELEDEKTTEASLYILNTKTKKYHLTSCPSVSKIAVKNKEESALSAEKIEGLGYEPCKNCLE